MIRTSGIALTRTRQALLCSVTGLALTASPAFAQASDQSGSDTGEIIVTAQKREQNIQDVPISMAVVGGQKIAEMGIKDADRVKLHFEIRRQGKPVDPSRYLPAR